MSDRVQAPRAPSSAPPSVRATEPPVGLPRSAASARVTGALGWLLRFFSSYGLAVTLLLLLLTLTLLGTLEQASSSLYDVQRKYFESLFLVHHFGAVPVPLPGATLVLALLAVNLVVGGIVRMRWKTRTIGILVAHFGILMLLGGSLIEYYLSNKGRMTLHEGESAAEFQSYYDWEIAVRERLADGSAKEFVLPYDRLAALDPSDLARFTSKGLPFAVEVTGWTRNAQPRRTGPPTAPYEGWVIKEIPAEKEAEQNMPAAYVTLRSAPSAKTQPSTLLFGPTGVPWVVTTQGGRRFEVELRARRWELPFTIALDRFVHAEHPGTSMAREYSSYVTKLEGGVAREVHITMNEPLRNKGYTFYQSGWGPTNAPPGTPLYSTFSVVQNPSDRMPLISCIVIALGLLWQFLVKLYFHIRAESKQFAKPAGSPA